MLLNQPLSEKCPVFFFLSTVARVTGMGNCLRTRSLFKQRFCCCRCGQRYDLLGDLEAHCYLEYLELRGRDRLPQTQLWRCYGCLRKYKNFWEYYGHFGKTWARVTPDDDPRLLNLLSRFKHSHGKI